MDLLRNFNKFLICSILISFSNKLFSIKKKLGCTFLLKSLVIDENNLSYKHLNTNTHPNFFLIENNLLEKNIKIDQVRNLLKFLNKTTYSGNLKIIMIDNVENLNLNSSNALLKAILMYNIQSYFC